MAMDAGLVDEVVLALDVNPLDYLAQGVAALDCLAVAAVADPVAAGLPAAVAAVAGPLQGRIVLPPDSDFSATLSDPLSKIIRRAVEKYREYSRE